MDVERLNEAFTQFAAASKTLETSYGLLQEKVRYLTSELEIRNRQLSQALAEAEQNKDYLRAVLYNIEESIIVLDPEERVAMMNRSAETLLGVSQDAARGRRFNSLDFSLASSGTDAVLEVKGNRFLVIVSHSDIVDAAGWPRGSVVLIKDITLLRETEQRHERNERLIAMGEMAVKIVHELRNPLCSIELFATMLANDLKDTRHRDLAGGISSGISSLNTILTNMLMFARPHKPALTSIRLDRVVQDAVGMVRPLLESRGVLLNEELAEREINGDAELLKQVFMNIIINAVQAMPGGGELSVRVRGENGRAAVDVRDSGDGISPGMAEKIFDPFFSTKENGTGLGLAIASSIMQAHGGFITAASEAGKGSTFTLTFPIQKSEPRNHEGAA